MLKQLERLQQWLQIFITQLEALQDPSASVESSLHLQSIIARAREQLSKLAEIVGQEQKLLPAEVIRAKTQQNFFWLNRLSYTNPTDQMKISLAEEILSRLHYDDVPEVVKKKRKPEDDPLILDPSTGLRLLYMGMMQNPQEGVHDE